jgi:hypothetical protein
MTREACCVSAPRPAQPIVGSQKLRTGEPVERITFPKRRIIHKGQFIAVHYLNMYWLWPTARERPGERSNVYRQTALWWAAFTMRIQPDNTELEEIERDREEVEGGNETLHSP